MRTPPSFILPLSLTVVALALTASTSPAVEPDWIVDCDWQAVLAEKSGEWVREIAAQKETARKLKSLEALTGFDPLSDLDRIRLFGQSDDPQSGVLALDGRFDGERLVAIVGGIEGYRVEGGAPLIHSWIDPNKGERVYAAVIDDRQVVIGGQLSTVRSALTEPLPDIGDADADADGSRLLSARAVGFDQFQNAHPQAKILRQVERATIDIEESDGRLELALDLTGRDEGAGKRILQVAEGLHALAMLGDPGEREPVANAMLEAFGADRSDTTVHLQTAVSIELLRSETESGWLNRLESKKEAETGEDDR